MTGGLQGLELRATLSPVGTMRLGLDEVPVRTPGPGEVLVRVEAAPVNPTDLLLLAGPVEIASMAAGVENGRPILTAQVPAAFMPALRPRIGMKLTAGLEGAGTVIAAGKGAEAWIGRTVAMWDGGMFAQYRTLSVENCALLPADVSAAEGASNSTNPMTALAMVETIRRQGHRAFVQTAAASNLGQMLNRIAQADGFGVVSIVRSTAQIELLRDSGAEHVLDSGSASFLSDLTDAIGATGARVAFDFIGGGRMAGTILQAMEAALRKEPGVHPLYGSSTYKHVHICGGLDRAPVELDRRPFGQAWGVSGFYVGNALAELGPDATTALRARALRELKTTFASHYAATISLCELLDPNLFEMAMLKITNGKYLLDPTR